MTGTFEKQITAIHNIFPSAISDVIVHDNGDDFLVLEINHEWMFRFPRNEVSEGSLEVEKRFLASFKTQSPLPVPDYQYISSDFIGYKKIKGTPFHLEMFQSLSKESLGKITQQLGQFLSVIHNFPIAEAKRIGLTEDWDDWHIQNFREKVAPMLSASARQNALTCLEQRREERFEAQVIHGDFALEDHVFFDEARQELSGVIDFGDVTLNDPAHDFQNIVEYGGEEYFDSVMEYYEGKSDSTLLKRTKLRIQTRPLFEASSLMQFGFDQRFKQRMEWIEGKFGRV